MWYCLPACSKTRLAPAITGPIYQNLGDERRKGLDGPCFGTPREGAAQPALEEPVAEPLAAVRGHEVAHHAQRVEKPLEGLLADARRRRDLGRGHARVA